MGAHAGGSGGWCCDEARRTAEKGQHQLLERKQKCRPFFKKSHSSSFSLFRGVRSIPALTSLATLSFLPLFDYREAELELSSLSRAQRQGLEDLPWPKARARERDFASRGIFKKPGLDKFRQTGICREKGIGGALQWPPIRIRWSLSTRLYTPKWSAKGKQT